jgi:hypothetical protein
MGSRWEEHPTEPEQREGDRFGLSRPAVGLEAAELDLLRSAPDYDAEEMASVHPAGGWPTLPAAERNEPPPPPAWRPPNRVEPPARAFSLPVEPPARPARLPEAGEATAGTRTRFPEERTVALMAEDLLGRPLDEPEPTADPFSSPVPVGVPRPARSAPSGGDNVWDSAMPLLAEG